ncbi:MAG: hypothetical protein RLN80_01970 [Rhodospirillales bacterium]
MMPASKRLRDLAFLVPLGCLLLFMPPYIGIFDQPWFLFGIPVLQIFIFSVWLAGIVMTALVAARYARHTGWPEAPDRRPDPPPENSAGKD